MAIKFTGNADVDFVRGMIPHHEGAVEMAKVLLRYGSDGELLKPAAEIVRSQSADIVTMIGWLRRSLPALRIQVNVSGQSSPLPNQSGLLP